jgi:hypothetical protein
MCSQSIKRTACPKIVANAGPPRPGPSEARENTSAQGKASKRRPGSLSRGAAGEVGVSWGSAERTRGRGRGENLVAESSKGRWARTEHHLAARPAAARLVWLADCGRTSLHCMVRGLRTDTPGPPRAKKRALFRPVSPAKSLRAPTPGPSG